MKRGEIYYITNTNRGEGNEIQGNRPAVIVSNDTLNKTSGVVEIVYTTAQPKKDQPTHVLTRNTPRPSTILCEQVHTVSTSKVCNKIGELTEQELAAVDTALAISLGLDFGNTPVMREPTEEELLNKLSELTPLDFAKPGTDAQLIKLETERDLYRRLYSELLENITKGAIS